MQVFCVASNGDEFSIEFQDGQTLLEVLESRRLLPDAYCEGNGICGGCHVYIENMLDKLPALSDLESDALDRARGLAVNSRIACQIVLNAGLDGLKVRIP